jgi:hypothetical protein
LTWALLSVAIGWAGVRALSPAFVRFAASDPGAADRTGHAIGSLVANLAEATARGQTRVDSPSGARLGAEAFADVRFLTVPDTDDPQRDSAGISRRQWLYLHPPSSVSLEVALPDQPGLQFQAALALDPATWEAPTGDGVRFLVSVVALGATGPAAAGEVLDLEINPRARLEHRRWVPVVADLAPWRGQRVRLTLTTDPRADLTYDWAGWANPVIVTRHTARSASAAERLKESPAEWLAGSLFAVAPRWSLLRPMDQWLQVH